MVFKSVRGLVDPAGKNKLLKNSSDTIWDRTRDFAACSSVPQPTRPLLAPADLNAYIFFFSENAELSRVWSPKHRWEFSSKMDLMQTVCGVELL